MVRKFFFIGLSITLATCTTSERENVLSESLIQKLDSTTESDEMNFSIRPLLSEPALASWFSNYTNKAGGQN